ncbi:unnamed protein product [Didymodactylos carnosus]|uniref:Thyroid transcription factor 1-associated protein 26 n=1 Tax=Didymodactylos carnosus TaxID=1234261 RepID=A0A814E610_9BILA|nr:unnamed protein product [Didymodactylos carnosus]CAF0967577.1 unnamed protein product [Didymodactylos carnosus]CAF3672781.1 unnamed protein product [Didymodactylos carnosus]CAF3740940.1 unnamed protein product [Didymodactylos carnosus]
MKPKLAPIQKEKEKTLRKDKITKSFNQKLRDDYLTRKEQQQAEKQANIERKKDIEQSLKQYKKTKQNKYKKIAKRTKSGQPLMKGQMELLLEKIQKSKE